MKQLMSEEPSLDFAMDGLSIDDAIAYLQSLKARFDGQHCVLSNDCVDDITGVTALNLYAVE
jgi:hypothetical protein